MADLEKPLRDLIIDETPTAISVTRKGLNEVLQNPEVKNLLEKFDVVPSSAGKVELKAPTPEAKEQLTDLLHKGMSSAPSAPSAPQAVAPPAGFSAPPPVAQPETLTEAITGRKSLSLGPKMAVGAGLGAAGVAGAAYMGAGSGPTEQAAKAEPAPVDTTGSAPSSAGVSASAEESARREPPRVTAQEISTPESFEKAVNALGTEPGGQVEWKPEDEKKWADQLDRLRAIYREARTRSDWLEVAEKISHALTQFFAAQQGLRTGVDMSGLKFDKTDWFKKQDQLLDDLRVQTGIVQKQRDDDFQRVKTARDALENYKRMKSSALTNQARAEAGTAETNARLRQGADETNARSQQAYDEMDFRASEGDKNRATTLDAAGARAGAAETKASEKRSAALGRAANLFGAIDDLPKKDQARARLDALRAAADAGIPPETIQKWQQEADEQDGIFSGKPAAQYVAEKIAQWGGGAAQAPGIEGTRAPAGTVKMRDPKTGKIGFIPAANVAQAKADGLEEVP